MSWLSAEINRGKRRRAAEQTRKADFNKNLDARDSAWDMATGGGMKNKPDSEFSRSARADADYDRYEGGVSGAISRLEGMRSSGFEPSETGGFTPGRLDGIGGVGELGLNDNFNDVSNFDPEEQRGLDFEGIENFNPSEMEGFETGDLSEFSKRNEGARSAAADFRGRDFDAGAALKEWATGAASDMFKQQKTELGNLAGKSVGAGRLDTGFFDEDQGDVINESNRGFNSALAAESVNAAGITANSMASADRTSLDALRATDEFRHAGMDRSFNALSEAANLRFKRAQGIDDSRQTGGIEAGRLKMERAQGIDRARQDAGVEGARLGLDADRNKLTGRGQDIDIAGRADEMSLDRAQFMDTSRQRAQEFSDDYAMEGATSGLGFREGQAGRGLTRSENSRNRYLDMLDAGRRREVDRDAIRRGQYAKNDPWQIAKGVVDTVGSFV